LRRKDTVRAAVKNLGRVFIGRKVGQITPELCKAYRAHRAAMPRAQYTKDPKNAPRVGDPMIRRELEVLQAAIGVAYEDRKLKYRVPVWLPDPPPARERFLQRDEIAALVWAAWRQDQGRSKHLARFILVSFYTGSRAAALLSLQWMANTTGGWVNLEQGVIYRKARAETETDKRRPPVGISRRLAAHLSRWRPKNRKGHVIEADGAAVKSVRRAFHTARVAAGLGGDVVIHTLRHTFASHAIMNGVSFGEVAEAIKRDLGGFDKFKADFNAAGGRVFGSGWVFVTVDKGGKLALASRPNQDNPLMDKTHVLLGNDVWEHAYYLKYQNRRADYIAAWWNVVNWEKVESLYVAAR
jgi:superoxide dismutase